MGTSGTRLDPTVVHAAAVEAVEGLDLVVAEGGKVPEVYLPDRLADGQVVVGDGSGNVPEDRLPARLSADGLSASFVSPKAMSGDGPVAPLPFINVKDFGAVGDGLANDTAAVAAAVAASTRGLLYFPAGTYLIDSTLELTDSISLLGDGAGTADSPSTAQTTIKFAGITGAIVSYSQVKGIKVDGIRFDGDGKATIGIYADRLRNSAIKRLGVSGCTTAGIVVTTEGTVAHDNSMFNVVREVHVSGCPIGIHLAGDTANLCNSSHNALERVTIAYTGAYGLLFGNADNNTAVDLMTTRISGTGKGIGFVGDPAAGDGALARSNYLYHVQGTVFARAGSKNNFIFGYDQENGQADPVVEAGARLTWLGNAGAVQQNYWSVSQYIDAPNITQRNRFINGGFDIWTYGTSFSNPAASARIAPRWQIWYNNTLTSEVTREAFTKGQTDVPNNPRYFAKVAIASGTFTSAAIWTRIEGCDALSGQYVRVTFWARWSGATPMTLQTVLKQNFGTGGSPSSTVSTASGNAPLTSSWQKFSFFVNLPSIAGKTFGSNGDDELIFELDFANVGAGDLCVGQFKIEPGVRESPYVRRDMAEEESLCARYVQSLTAQVGTADTVLAFRTMAKNPTVTGGGSGFSVTGISPSYIRATQSAVALQTLLLRAE